MMHRLHFQEAQQSSYAINPAHSGQEARADRDSSSLAAEFQSLLAQMAGNVVTMPDHVTAIGTALAQVSSPDRERPQNEAAKAPGDSHVQRDQGETSGTLNASEDDASSDSVDSRLDQDKGAQDYQISVSEEEQQSDNDGDRRNIDDSAVATDLVVMEAQQIVSNSGIQSLPQQLSQTESNDSDTLQEFIHQHNDEHLVAQSDISSTVLEQDSLTEGQMQDAKQLIVTGQKGDKPQDSEEEIEDESLLPEAFGIQEDGDYDAEGGKNAGKIGQRNRMSGDAPLVPDGHTEGNSSTDPQSSHRFSRGEDVKSQSENQIGDEPIQLRKNSVGKKETLQVSSGEPLSSDVAGSEVASREQEPRSETNMQVLLLRQAFESVRMNQNDLGELGRSRTQSTGIQPGVGVSESKATTSEHSTRSKVLTRPQVARMLERVETTLKEAARSRDGKTISLRLEPVDLGKVKVDVSLREGTLHARISPENQQVMQALREHAHELQGVLRKLGLNVDSVTVSVASDDFSREMATGQETMDGNSFQQDRNDMPQQRGQLVDNTIGNELALRTGAEGESRRSAATDAADHWIA